MKLFLKTFLGAVGIFFATQSFADAGVNLILTKGSDKAIPLAMVPFSGSEGENFAGIIAQDLRFSGQFKIPEFSALPSAPNTLVNVDAKTWQQAHLDDVVVGEVASQGGRLNVRFALGDLSNNVAQVQSLISQTYNIPNAQSRALAHHISDLIFEKLTGVKGIFSTRIAYIQANPSNYALFVSDADGFNPRAILVSKEPIMSPAWSPDGKKIAYVSFEGQRAQIFVANVATGQRQRVSAAPGINGAPAWSPDGHKLALVLSKSGTPKIYILDIASSQLKQMTTGNSIDTEPNFAPDGQSLIFTSDRGGSPQIYRLWLNTGKIERITFSGDYNARASFSRDGKQIVMINRNNGEYNIAIQNLSDGLVQVLTNSGRNDSPTLSPNGMMVLYGNEFGELGLVSVDGRVKLRVPGKGGKVQDPAWSPFL